MPNTSSALKKEENRRLRADRGRVRDFFKRTLCMVESYPTIYVSRDSLEPPPVVSSEEPDSSNSRSPDGNAIRRVTGGYAAQSKDWDASSPHASPAKPFEALGCRHFVS